jgi:16S rRNA (uracil1498-N3)-methyltransferase
MPRFYCAAALASDTPLALASGAARHAQVLRLQPGDSITLFDGRSADEFDATITRMGRSEVQVQVGQRHTVAREATRQIHLAVGMPANDRMDWLVEKATELGVASIQPLITERSVLKLSGERADKKVAHWQSVAIAACEQCGGNLLPVVQAMQTLPQWLKQHATGTGATPPAQRLLLSLRGGSAPVRPLCAGASAVWFLSGPEGGLSPSEEDTAIAIGFSPASLGPRVLRAETAALVALAQLTQCA